MLLSLLKILLGVSALIGAGAFSYIYLEQTVGEKETVQETQIVVKKVISKATTTEVVQKKVTAKTPVATPVVTPAKTDVVLVPKTVVAEKIVVTPGPLRAVLEVPSTSVLSVRGVIERTNIERAQNGGLHTLTENFTLNLVAQMKVPASDLGAGILSLLVWVSPSAQRASSARAGG